LHRIAVNVPTFPEKRTASIFVVSELIATFSKFLRMEQRTNINPKEDIHFINDGVKVWQLIHNLMLEIVFLGGSLWVLFAQSVNFR
jgi:hypothetical protein